MRLKSIACCAWVVAALWMTGCSTIWGDVSDWWDSQQGGTNVPPVVTNVPPVVTNEVPADFEPPPRLGADSYVGHGVLMESREIPGGRNATKRAVLQSWVKINSFVLPNDGTFIINKGSVGNSFSYGLRVHPDKLGFQSTGGAVFVPVAVTKKAWHHVRVVADKKQASFWLDGRFVGSGKPSGYAMFSQNAWPLRIGGNYMAWTNTPSPWFNFALDGEMSDWSVDVE